jgi:protoheme IX farnesyltransferase
MRPLEALTVGGILAAGGVTYLALTCNGLSAFLAALTIGIYIFAYTPLKRISSFNTLVGAIPGAIPPMIGWAAARGRIDPGAWSLFVIMMLWQLPHFFAISWMYREDYSKAGFEMISKGDTKGDRSASQSVFFAMLLLVVAGLPGFVGVVSQIYVPISLVLGAWYVAMAMRFLQKPTPRAARTLFLTSVIYLPLLLAALVFTKL